MKSQDLLCFQGSWLATVGPLSQSETSKCIQSQTRLRLDPDLIRFLFFFSFFLSTSFSQFNRLGDRCVKWELQKKQRKTNPKNKTKQTNKQNRPTKKNRSFNSTRRDPNSVHTGQLSRNFRRRAYGRQIRDRAGNGDRWLRRGQPPSTKDRQHPLLFEEKETHTHTQSERERERESEIRPRSMGRSTPGKRLQLVSPLTSPILLTWTRLRRNTRATFRF